jgi:hypothetical protein
MADIVFNITSFSGDRKTALGKLVWSAKGFSSDAISGPHGNGALPTGLYTAPRSKLLDKHGQPPYCDGFENCWMQAMAPNFSTSRTGLGIHPDGNAPGTEGCIGLKGGNTKPWYDAFYAVSSSGSVSVEVRDDTRLDAAKSDLDAIWAYATTLEEQLHQLQEQLRLQGETQESLLRQFYHGVAPTATLRWFAQTSDGWVVTLDSLDSSGSRRPLPSHLEIDFLGSSGGRDRFRVKEGVHAGKTGSIQSGSGLLSSVDPHGVSAEVKFENRVGGPTTIGGVTYDKQVTIMYGSTTKGPYNAKTDPSNPVPAGTHDLNIPDFPHDLGLPYGQYGKAWFRIGNSGDRYLHPGRVSAGCITCEPSSWTDIYEALIVRRRDSENVGVVVVR